MPSDPLAALGAYLTASEAGRLAASLEAGETTSQALREIHAARRTEVRRMLAEADLGPHRIETTMAVLRAVAGARAVRTLVTPVWTMPGAQANTGRLTSEVQRLITEARLSVVCSSYNFSPHSQMWTALRDASNRDGVTVTVYLDAEKGDATAVAGQMPKANVYRTLTLAGARQPVVSHAKFIIIDRTLVLLTSANFSHSAENTNIELGLLVADTALAESIESLIRDKQGILYERV
jgi:phosphatidylserine/phosphatidylglycerophosphate/cardiolipin synthase-like enzyme